MLRAAGVAEARREAGTLLAHSINRDRGFLITHPEDQVAESQLVTYRSFVDRRSRSEPLQHITGHQDFFKLSFEVNRHVLVPRPETELIVEVSLELLDETEPLIADIGTGSGCVIISLLHELPPAQAVGVDISPAALTMARKNAGRHGVSNRLRLVESDGFAKVDQRPSFSLIVSNPPYITDAEFETLPREVRDYDPRVALLAGPDGLSVIRRLLADAPEYLRARGHFVLEIGFGQAEAVKTLIDSRVWELREIRKDLQGIERTVVLQKRAT